VRSYTVRAHNTASDSGNKIHDDTVARRYGFAGGLVPGVDVYAYMTHPVAEAWGRDWLAHGTFSARFAKPVYEGEDVIVTAADGPTSAVTLTLTNAAGIACATGAAAMPDAAPALPSIPPRLSLPDPPPAAEPDVIAALGVLGAWERTFHADAAAVYLADIRETLPLYEGGAVCHPAWLVRTANYVLSSNMTLGPWIHVESRVQHHGVIGDGQAVSTRATVATEYERKGHRFVELDVVVLADDVVAAAIRHVAIYRPRPVH
jgi:hypothetical protein